MPCNSRVVDGCGNVDKADRESPNRGSGQVLRVGDEEDPADRPRLEPSGNSRGFLSCRAWTGLGEDLLARHPQIAREPGRRVVGDVGFVLNLPNDPERVRGPGLAFISNHRLPGGRPPDGFLRGAPDLAVEVLSPNDNPVEVQQRVRDYLDAGARLVWIIVPQAKAATVSLAELFRYRSAG